MRITEQLVLAPKILHGVGYERFSVAFDWRMTDAATDCVLRSCGIPAERGPNNDTPYETAMTILGGLSGVLLPLLSYVHVVVYT